MDFQQFVSWMLRQTHYHGLESFTWAINEDHPKIMIWSERSHDFRELKAEHLAYDAKSNEVRIVLDEVQGE